MINYPINDDIKEQGEILEGNRWRFIRRLVRGETSTSHVLSDPTFLYKSKSLRVWIIDKLLDSSLNKIDADHLVWVGNELGLFPIEQLKDTVLQKYRASVFSSIKKGSDCPCCGQRVKEYKRSFNKNQAIFLRDLVKMYISEVQAGNEGWIHYSKLNYHSRDYPYLRSWGLAITRPDPAGKKRTSGEWKPTQMGIDFVFNKIRIPKYIFTFNGKLTETVEESSISFGESLGEEFDFQKLMNAYNDLSD